MKSFGVRNDEVRKNDLRLVFEIERVGQLFDDYKKVQLEIWRTFTDITLKNYCYLLKLCRILFHHICIPVDDGG